MTGADTVDEASNGSPPGIVLFSDWLGASDSPRVEACIAGVMRRFPGQSVTSSARFFEAVHQELAPLARALERELSAIKGGE